MREQVRDEGGEQGGAPGQRVDEDVLVGGMRAASDRAEAVERRRADARGEVAVGAPPTAAADGLRQTQPPASARARSNSAADAAASSGGRLGPPVISNDAPGTTARSERRARIDPGLLREGRGRGRRRRTTPRRGRCWSWCRPRITVGVTVVPAGGSASAATTSAWCASSTVALTPSSGSSPACAARP